MKVHFECVWQSDSGVLLKNDLALVSEDLSAEQIPFIPELSRSGVAENALTRILGTRNWPIQDVFSHANHI